MTEGARKIIVWVIKGALFVIPFIPLYVSQILFFPYITGKAFIFRTLIEIAFAFWLWLAIAYPEYRPRKTILLYAILFFIGVVTLSSVLGVNPYRSFWSNFERMEGLLTYLHLAGYFLVLSSVFNPRAWFVFLNLFVVSGIAQNTYALFQKLGFLSSPQGGFRVDGTIGNPTYVAAYLLFVLLFAFLLLVTVRNRYARYFYWFVIVFTLLVTYFTATRGVILALVLGALLSGVLYLFFARRGTVRERKYTRAVVIALVALVLLSAGLKAFKNTPLVKGSEILSRLSSISLAEGKSRFIIWNMGWSGLKERPILGWGPENYNLIFAKYYNPALYTQEPWFDRSHNIIFDWLINAGIVGLGAYLGMFIAALYLLWKRYLQLKKSALEEKNRAFHVTMLFSVFLFVYFFQNIFVFDQLATYLGFFALLAYVQRTAVGEEGGEAAPKGMRGWSVNTAIAGGIIGIALAFALYHFVYLPLSANRHLLTAMSRGNSQDLPGSFGAFRQALAFNTFGDAEISEQFTRFGIAAVTSSNLDQAFKEQVLNEVVQAARRNIEQNPRDPRAHLFLGALYRDAGLLDEAVRALQEALRLSPRKQQIHFELADVYIRKGESGRAVEVLKAAYDLEKRFDEARINLIAGYVLNGEGEKADALLMGEYGRTDVPLRLLVQVYTFKKDFTRLLGVWQAFVQSEPENVDYRKNVAAIYLELGKPKEAIKALEEAVKQIPSFKEEAEEHIKNIKAGNF